MGYPWRTTEAVPYATLVSEVMLQQTQASRVGPVFEAFIARFPTVVSLADAPRGAVLTAWAGLGYHRRAVALHDAARTIVRDHAGSVPREPAALRALAGVGPYTAAAVASIAFGVPVPAVDTNVRKVVARLVFGAERDEITARQAEEAAAAWLDRDRPGEWNQAVMNLGREVCRTRPRCEICPLATACCFRASGREGRPSVRPHTTFHGSMREARGAVVAALRHRSPSTLGAIERAVDRPADRVREAVVALHRDGVVEASEAALRGRPQGRVGFPET
ncbi:MAG: A/G-specific adenine glycosylase [Actinomycetota bacterium]